MVLWINMKQFLRILAIWPDLLIFFKSTFEHDGKVAESSLVTLLLRNHCSPCTTLGTVLDTIHSKIHT